MEQERFDKLFFGREYMDAEILTVLESFRRFIENDFPVVSVLCTDQRLLSQMDKLTSESDNVNYHVCGTFDDTEDAVERAFWSDAVIVDTLALKIAPAGLYKVMKEISVLNKDVYFILSGWESLPKTTELGRDKLAQVDNEFPFLRIKACKNVFVKEREGFSLIEDVLGKYDDLISDNFSFNHAAQVDAIYKVLRKKVRAFRESACNEIQKEQNLILRYQSTLRAKQGMYELTITHASVGVSESLDRLERNLKGFNLDGVLYSLETELSSAKESYFENPQAAENEVKLFVCKRIIKEIDYYLEKESGSDPLSSETSMQISNIVNDLTSMTAALKKCKFISADSFNSLEKVIKETDKLINCAENYNNSVNLILERVKEMLEPKVMSFKYEEFNEGVVEKMLGNLKSIVRDVKSLKDNIAEAHEASDRREEKDCEPEEGLELNEDEADCEPEKGLDLDEEENEVTFKAETAENRKWKYFCEETQRMLDYAKNVFSALLRDNSRIATETINIQGQNTVREYFGSVMKLMDIISQGLSKLLSEYGRDDI